MPSFLHTCVVALCAQLIFTSVFALPLAAKEVAVSRPTLVRQAAVDIPDLEAPDDDPSIKKKIIKILQTAGEKFLVKGLEKGSDAFFRWISPPDTKSPCSTLELLSNEAPLKDPVVESQSANDDFSVEDMEEKEIAQELQAEAIKAVNDTIGEYQDPLEEGISTIERLYRFAILANKPNASEIAKKLADRWERWWLRQFPSVPHDSRTNAQKLLVYTMGRLSGEIEESPEKLMLEQKLSEHIQ